MGIDSGRTVCSLTTLFFRSHSRYGTSLTHSLDGGGGGGWGVMSLE